VTSAEIRSRMWPQFRNRARFFLVGMLTISRALLMRSFARYIDFAGVVLCVVAMSARGFYIIAASI